MSVDFSKWNKAQTEEDKKAIEDAKSSSGFSETPKGEYIAKIEAMELGETKDHRPMFKVMMRLVEGAEEGSEADNYVSAFKKKKPCVFMNKVVAGTKNDNAMLGSVLGWMDKLELEKPIQFNGDYNNLAEDILDAFEEVDGIEMLIAYDPEAFNSISIKEIYE